MKRGKCSANCEKCPYFRKPCIGCMIKTFSVDRCIEATSYTGITHPGVSANLGHIARLEAGASSSCAGTIFRRKIDDEGKVSQVYAWDRYYWLNVLDSVRVKRKREEEKK